jgi:hypothetical protein
MFIFSSCFFYLFAVGCLAAWLVRACVAASEEQEGGCSQRRQSSDCSSSYRKSSTSKWTPSGDSRHHNGIARVLAARRGAVLEYMYTCTHWSMYMHDCFSSLESRVPARSRCARIQISNKQKKSDGRRLQKSMMLTRLTVEVPFRLAHRGVCVFLRCL